MANNDSLSRFIFKDAPIRGEFIFLHESFQIIINQHAYPPSIKRLLGEALCLSGLLSAIIKFNGRLTVQFRGDGKLKLLLAQCDNHFHLRGLAKWEGDLSYSDLMDSFNHGLLVIILDAGLKSQYQGIVSWRGNSMVESIEGYFKESEQLSTRIWLSVDDQSAAGFLLQVIPEKADSAASIEKGMVDSHWQRIIELTKALNPEQMLKLDYKALLDVLYPEEEIRLFSSLPLSFHCSCSRKRGEDAILLLGKEEAEEELKSKQAILVTCDFCNKEYMFDRKDVAKIFKDRPSSVIQFH